MSRAGLYNRRNHPCGSLIRNPAFSLPNQVLIVYILQTYLRFRGLMENNPRAVLDSWIPSLCNAQFCVALLVGFSADRTPIWLILTWNFLPWLYRINGFGTIFPSFRTKMDQNPFQTDGKLTEILWKHNLMRYLVLYKLDEPDKWRNLWNQLRIRFRGFWAKNIYQGIDIYYPPLIFAHLQIIIDHAEK